MIIFDYTELLKVGVAAESLTMRGIEFVDYCSEIFKLFESRVVAERFLTKMISSGEKRQLELFLEWTELVGIVNDAKSSKMIEYLMIGIMSVQSMLAYIGMDYPVLPGFLVKYKTSGSTLKYIVKFSERRGDMSRIERFIENYPKQFEEELRNLLTKFSLGEISREKVREITYRNIDVALNTIIPEKAGESLVAKSRKMITSAIKEAEGGENDPK